MKKITPIILLAVLSFSSTALAKQFEVFDGQFYNGQYYPLVDNIEWGEQDGELPHMEFHVHSDKQIEVTVEPGEKNGKPVFWIVYDLRFRNERVCRHVLAPRQFKEGTKVYAYRDLSDPDYVNFFFSSEPRKEKKLTPYTMPPYQPCTDEYASNKPSATTPATNPSDQRSPASTGSAPESNAEKKTGKNIGIDYDNSAVPFSF